jgi:hypothetical protein
VDFLDKKKRKQQEFKLIKRGLCPWCKEKADMQFRGKIFGMVIAYICENCTTFVVSTFIEDPEYV